MLINFVKNVGLSMANVDSTRLNSGCSGERCIPVGCSGIKHYFDDRKKIISSIMFRAIPSQRKDDPQQLLSHCRATMFPVMS